MANQWHRRPRCLSFCQGPLPPGGLSVAAVGSNDANVVAAGAVFVAVAIAIAIAFAFATPLAGLLDVVVVHFTAVHVVEAVVRRVGREDRAATVRQAAVAANASASAIAAVVATAG